MKSILLGLCAALLVSGCSHSLQTYNDRDPEFDMRQFFSDKLCAWGVVRNRSGEATRKFSADINTYEKDGKLILDEVFLFDDGEEQTRIWEFTETGNNTWSGTAGDVVGTATGEINGDTLHLYYDLRVKMEDGDEIEVAMDDWLHLVNQDIMMGSTDMSKFGFNVGRIDIVMQRQKKDSDVCIQK